MLRAHAQVLCLSINFYVRLFVRVYASPAAVRDAASKQMYVFQSQGCDSFFTQRVGRKARPPAPRSRWPSCCQTRAGPSPEGICVYVCKMCVTRQ